MDIKTKAYHKYQLHWMMDRGYSIKDLMEEISKYQDNFDDDIDVFDAFAAWEQDVGFSGELWVCFDEFIGAEYLDSEYMKYLLTDKEYEEYLIDIKED